MKALLISFVVGLLVDVLYAVIRVKSPAPPIIALVGLLGMVLGEQGGGWLLAKRIHATGAAPERIAVQGKNPKRPNALSAIPAVYERSRQ